MNDQPVNLNGLPIDAILGIVVSILGGIFTSCKMADWLKQVIIIVISIAFAGARCYITGDLTPTNIAASIVAVVLAAYTAYQTITEKIAKNLQANVGVGAGVGGSSAGVGTTDNNNNSIKAEG